MNQPTSNMRQNNHVLVMLTKWIGQDLGLRKKEAVKKKLAIEKDWLAKNKKISIAKSAWVGDKK